MSLFLYRKKLIFFTFEFLLFTSLKPPSYHLKHDLFFKPFLLTKAAGWC